MAQCLGPFIGFDNLDLIPLLLKMNEGIPASFLFGLAPQQPPLSPNILCCFLL